MGATETVPHRRRPLAVIRSLAPVDGESDDAGRFVLRRIEPWSVFKLSLMFYLCVCGVLLMALVFLWIGTELTGVIGNIESFVQDAGFTGFRFRPFQLFRALGLIGVILVLAGSAASTLLAVLFNLMSSVLGGLRVTLAEDPSPPVER